MLDVGRLPREACMLPPARLWIERKPTTADAISEIGARFTVHDGPPSSSVETADGVLPYVACHYGYSGNQADSADGALVSRMLGFVDAVALMAKGQHLYWRIRPEISRYRGVTQVYCRFAIGSAPKEVPTHAD
jgi:hypothetical protein